MKMIPSIATTFLTGVLLLSGASLQAAAPQKAPHPAEAAPPIHNGLWWEGKSRAWREGFITGYKSGSTHLAGHPIDITPFPAVELVDGVDRVYNDNLNRNILVDDVLTYVQDELRGTPDDRLKAELLKMRVAAAPTNSD